MSTLVWIVIVYFIVGMVTATVVRGLCWLTAVGASVPSSGWRDEVIWLLRAGLLWPFLALAVGLSATIYFGAFITIKSIARSRTTFDFVEQHEGDERGDTA